MQPYKFTKNKIDSNTIKYQFEKPDGNKLTQNELIELLKSENKEFLKTFTDSLNNATQEFSGAYLWKCPPISKQTLNQKFEFVTIKSTSLDNATQNHSAYQQYINSNPGKLVCSFPNLSNDAILTIPLPQTNKDFKNISTFTKNASEKQQQEFWKEVATKLSEEIEKDSNPRWLNTHGLGIDYLHVRIDQKPKYYGNYEEYKNPTYVPTPIPRTPKEKLLANLDKLCLAPDGFLANNEHLKTDEAEEERKKLLRQDREQWKNRYMKIFIQGEEIDLEDFFVTNNANDYIEVKRELIKKLEQEIRQNPSEWKIERGKNDSDNDLNYLIKHQQTGQRYWKYGFLQYWGNNEEDRKSWTKIENALKNSPNQQPQTEEKNWYNPFDYPLSWTMVIVLSVSLIVITAIFWKRNKKKI